MGTAGAGGLVIGGEKNLKISGLIKGGMGRGQEPAVQRAPPDAKRLEWMAVLVPGH